MPSLATYEEVLQTARLLPEIDRIRLVEELIDSMNPLDAAALDDAWLAEIDRRSAEIDAGVVQTITWDEVRRRARERAKLGE